MAIIPGAAIEAADVVEILDHSFLALGDRCTIITLDQFSLGTAGGGTATLQGVGLLLQTGAAANGRGFASVLVAGLGINDIREINWDKEIHIQINIARNLSVADTIARFQLKENTDEADLAAKGVGIVIKNLAIFAESYGTGRVETDTGEVLDATFAKTTIDIVHEPLVSVRFYVDGVLKVTHAVAANVPAGDSSGTVNYLVFSIDNQPAGGNSHLFAGGNILMWQDE